MRADARRNQIRILDAARSEITATGSDVSMEQIAKTAGVAVGTLYRHYPTKTHLVEAVLVEFSRSLVDRVEASQEALSEPGEAMTSITSLLSDFIEQAASNQAIKDASRVLDANYMTPELEDRGRRALGALVEAAHQDGDIKDGVTADDIYLLMLSAPSTLPESARARWLHLVLTGLANG